MRSLDHSRGLGQLAETASAIRIIAERLDVDTSNRWTRESTVSLNRLSERLVSDLMPQLAATDSVLGSRVAPDVRDALSAAHRRIRLVAERIAIVSEAVSRSRSRPGTGPVHRALTELGESLQQVELVHQAAVCRLHATLPASELAELTASLRTAAAEARAHIVMVAQPEPAATDAYVLRRRPDLDRAFTTNLDAMDPDRSVSE